MSDSNRQTMRVATKRELLMLLLGITAICYGFLHYWYEPRAKETRRLQQFVNEAKAKIENDATLAESLTKQAILNSRPPETDTQLEQIKIMNSNFANIIRELSGVGGMGRFDIRNLTVSKEEKMADYTRVLFTVEIEAPFLAIGSFLERLEVSKLLTEVVEIDVSRIEREHKRCQVKLSIYSYASRS
jgi:hypothetical protein